MDLDSCLQTDEDGRVYRAAKDSFLLLSAVKDGNGDRFLEDFPRLLRPSGRAYLLMTRSNHTARALAESRVHVRVAASKPLFFEQLDVLELRGRPAEDAGKGRGTGLTYPLRPRAKDRRPAPARSTFGEHSRRVTARLICKPQARHSMGES